MKGPLVKTFEARKPEGDPIPFRINGVRHETKPHEEGAEPEVVEVEVSYDFRAAPHLPAGPHGQYFEGILRGGWLPNELIAFISGVLIEEDRGRFDQLVNDHEVLVDSALLSEIAWWLFEEYTGRPTKRPSSSDRGPQSTGDTSEPGSGTEG